LWTIRRSFRTRQHGQMEQIILHGWLASSPQHKKKYTTRRTFVSVHFCLVKFLLLNSTRARIMLPCMHDACTQIEKLHTHATYAYAYAAKRSVQCAVHLHADGSENINSPKLITVRTYFPVQHTWDTKLKNLFIRPWAWCFCTSLHCDAVESTRVHYCSNLSNHILTALVAPGWCVCVV
jgi:hypothetical protein